MTESKKRPVEDLKGQQKAPKKVKKEGEQTGKKEFKGKFQGKSFGKKDGKFQKFHAKFGNKGKQGKKEEFKTNADGKTDWNDVKAKKKELKLQRKKNKTKDLYELSVQAKQIYEKLKCKSTPNKHELSTELHDLMKKGDCYTKLVHSHDIARVVQCLLKYSQAEIKHEIAKILIPCIVTMATSKYAHFCVTRMLKYGTKGIREEIINGFMKNIAKLVMHNFSNGIIDLAYNMHATNQQKAFMRQEFYSDLFRTDKDKKIEKLSDAWAGTPTLKEAILSRTKANLQKCANKNLVDNSLVHAVLLEFLRECKENDRQELIQTFSGLIAYLPSTKDGAMAAILCYLNAATKDRRAILKGLKEHVVKTCNHEFGHLLMITVINCTDDTVMLNKQIFSTILSQIEEIAGNEWGRKVLEWIVAPEDSAFFHPKFVKEVNEGLKFSKKDVETRRNEIKGSISKQLGEKIRENPKFWLRGGPTALLTGAILRICETDEVTNALAEVIVDPNWEVFTIEPEASDEKEEETQQIPSIKIKKPKKNPLIDDDEPKEEGEKVAGIEHSGLHVALKKIIKQKSKLMAAIIDKLEAETLKKWIPMNRACFILLNLIENSAPEDANKLKLKLDKALIKKESHPGAKILLKKL